MWAKTQLKKRILVLAIRAIGDVALITSVPRLLKQSYPTAYIGLLVDDPSGQILRANPHVDCVFSIDRRATRKLPLLSRIRKWFALVAQLRREKFDVAVDLFSGPRSAWLAWFCGATERYAEDYRSSWRGYLYNHSIRLVRDNRHLVEQKLDILRPLVGVVERKKACLEIHVTESERQIALDLLQQKSGRQGKRIGFVPGAGSPWRIWPAQRYAELGDRLAQEYEANIFLLGGIPEVGLCRCIVDKMSHPPVDLSGQTTLRELIALLSELDLVISNDSGPLHLTSALKKPKGIGLYGAANTVQYSPWGDNVLMLTQGKPSDAYWDKVDYQRDYAHLLKITVEDVFEHAGKILKT